MKESLWRIAAYIVSRRPVADYLIRRAQHTPYTHITSRRDGDSLYMARWWLFNPYLKDEMGDQLPARCSWLPSVRVHWIVRPDDDEHEHTHPWLARTIILRNGYMEERREEYRGAKLRLRGFTQAITPDVCHRITEVPTGGAYTLFFTWGNSQGWGFKVDGRVVSWRKYLKVDA
ncbi:hypothetical protein [Variovorax boronicumulans]|uniref:hypothetical protein n=1 Tax=Variovorax boronicumulans TaxID=436515 RepID=UPI0012E50FBD|nr:hypothetical protein [Variovorax boronicumulans]GER16712.1 hypothetical protein VCH24_17190 [Variovorax boronicumulans]